jgi:hypothetical protein
MFGGEMDTSLARNQEGSVTEVDFHINDFEHRVSAFAAELQRIREKFHIDLEGQIPGDALIVRDGMLPDAEKKARHHDPSTYRIVHIK